MAVHVDSYSASGGSVLVAMANDQSHNWFEIVVLLQFEGACSLLVMETMCVNELVLWDPMVRAQCGRGKHICILRQREVVDTRLTLRWESRAPRAKRSA